MSEMGTPQVYRTPSGWAVAQYEWFGTGHFGWLLRRRYVKTEEHARRIAEQWTVAA